MEIAESTQGAVLVFGLTGRLDSVSSPELDQAIKRVIGQGQRKLVIDCTGLEYVSSAGLRILMMAGKTLKAERGAMALCRLNDTVREIFRVSAFDRIFTILPSVEDSVARLGAA